jgi:hypothetical protein
LVTPTNNVVPLSAKAPQPSQPALVADTTTTAANSPTQGTQPAPVNFSAQLAAATAAGTQQGAANTQQARAQQTAAMQETFSGLNVFVNDHGGVYLRVQHGGRTEALPIDGEAALEHIMLEVKERTGASVGRDVIVRELGPIKARARRDGTTKHTANRCAKVPDGYVVDLGDAEGRVVHITAEESTMKGNTELMFLRGGAYGTLPAPEAHGSVSAALGYAIGWAERQGIPAPVAPLMVAAMVEYLRTDTPHPILAMVGAAGSGKSGAATRVTQCIDPTKSGALADVKPTPEDFAAAASVAYVLTADNLHKLPADVQDMLCKVSTGTVFTMRKYYTQGETFQVGVHQPLVLTFVSLGITAPDALDRTIICWVERPKAYRNASELQSEFEAERPKVTGALYTLLSAALRLIPDVVNQRAWHHRLVDYVQCGEAITQAAGHLPGYFLGLFEAHRATVAENVADGDSFMQVLRVVLKQIANDAQPGDKLPPWRQWGESKGAGLAAVRTPSGVVKIAIRPAVLLGKVPKVNQYIPENDRQLSEALTRVSPLLRALGIESERQENPGKRVAWVFAGKPGAFDA